MIIGDAPTPVPNEDEILVQVSIRGKQSRYSPAKRIVSTAKGRKSGYGTGNGRDYHKGW